jgi:hypothetical protein
MIDRLIDLVIENTRNEAANNHQIVQSPNLLTITQSPNHSTTKSQPPL